MMVLTTIRAIYELTAHHKPELILHYIHENLSFLVKVNVILL
jgi:hypothetical protein